LGRLTCGTLVLTAVVLVPSCRTASEPFPPLGSFTFDVTDTGIGSQFTAPPRPQVVVWTIDEAYATDITGYQGTYSFLGGGPCTYALNVVAPISFVAACGGSGLSLNPGVARTATIHVRISRLELRQAQRPDVSVGADPDGDGIPNEIDNCPIIYNPGQENSNAGDETQIVGDACSLAPSGSTERTIPDQDADGVADVVDNCIWYPSPADLDTGFPPDSNGDYIGDACERVAPVWLGSGGLALECPVSFTSRSGFVNLLRLDFAQPGLLDCDGSLTQCTLHTDPAPYLSLVGTTTTFPCTVVSSSP
jgi:hypothetical protein